MMRDSIVLRWTGEDADPRRVRFEPRDAGGWTRIEQRHNGDEWLTVGREIVSDVALDAPAAVIGPDATVE